MFGPSGTRTAAVLVGAFILLVAATLAPGLARADYSSSLSGTRVTFRGDSADDLLELHQVGGYLTHNRFGALDPGYVNGRDVDSSEDGEQRLSVAEATIAASPGEGNDRLLVDDAAHGDGVGYTVSPGDIGWGPGVSLEYSGYDHVDLMGTRFRDSFVVTGTSAPTQLYARAGGDDVLVGLGSVSAVSHQVLIDAGDGTDSVSVDDGGETEGHAYSLVGDTEFQRDAAWIIAARTEQGVFRTGRGPDRIALAGNSGPGEATRLETGSGNDVLELAGRHAGRVDGGPGADALDYHNRNSPVSVDLAAGTATGAAAGVSGFERVFGSVFDDTLRGGDGPDELFGGRGGDTITGGRGVDELFGEGGADTLDSVDGEVDERVVCGDGTDGVSADAVDPVDPSCELVRAGGAAGGAGGSGAGGGDVPGQAPEVSGLSLSRSAFRTRGGRRGTRIRFRLSEEAEVRVAIARRGRRGRRWVPVGAFARPGVGGPNDIRYSGRQGGRPLRPGGYRLTLVAVDRDGDASLPHRRRFRVLR